MNGIHVSRPVKCQLKVTNVQGDQAPAKRQEMLKKLELIHEDHRQTTHELTDTIGISYRICQEIVTENLNMRRIAPSSRQRPCPHVPEDHRFCD
jgi:C4-type Zn-finger protein